MSVFFGLLPTFVILGACVTGQPVHVTMVAERESVEIKSDIALAPMQFDKVAYKLKRGTIIGDFHCSLAGCYPLEENLFCNLGRTTIGGNALSDNLFGVLSEANFNVLVNPGKFLGGPAGN